MYAMSICMNLLFNTYMYGISFFGVHAQNASIVRSINECTGLTRVHTCDLELSDLASMSCIVKQNFTTRTHMAHPWEEGDFAVKFANDNIVYRVTTFGDGSTINVH